MLYYENEHTLLAIKKSYSIRGIGRIDNFDGMEHKALGDNS